MKFHLFIYPFKMKRGLASGKGKTPGPISFKDFSKSVSWFRKKGISNFLFLGTGSSLLVGDSKKEEGKFRMSGVGLLMSHVLIR